MSSDTQKPDLFAPGAKVSVQYQSPQSSDPEREQSVVGFVLSDDENILVVEEYSNLQREASHRHILVDLGTQEVYTQTEEKTQRIGEVTRIGLWSPPWDSQYDTRATGIGSLIFIKEGPPEEMIRVGLFEYVDPDYLDKPDGWSQEDASGDPIPDELEERYPDASYHPPVDTTAIKS